ncbi:MAG: zf-HC2 domain-containing protein [Candidatus Marinimicrobia bacterium]|nr:zf-HC2 domain-containing protein [Candidatus Neomarinimicrobiota bacterium]
MKTCKNIRDLIPLYIDENLSDEKNEKVKSHLEECGECRRYYQEMADLVDNISEQDFNIAQDYKNRLRVAVNEKIHKKKNRKFGLGLATAITTAVLLVAVLWTGLNDKNSAWQQSKITMEEIKIDEKYYDAYLSLSTNRYYGFEESDLYLPDEELEIDVSDIAYSLIETRGTESFNDIVALTGELSESDYSELLVHNNQ